MNICPSTLFSQFSLSRGNGRGRTRLAGGASAATCASACVGARANAFARASAGASASARAWAGLVAYGELTTFAPMRARLVATLLKQAGDFVGRTHENEMNTGRLMT
jgi:hypothetical protein